MMFNSLREIRERVTAGEFLQFEERDPCYTWLFPLALGTFDPRLAWRPSATPHYRDDLTLYVHIPFCRFICRMCPFTHEPLVHKDLGEYVEALCSEIEFYSRHQQVLQRQVTTLYFGGGTASSLAPAQLERILTSVRTGFLLSDTCEITLECHPRTVDRDYLAAVKALGINRVSFGIQSFSQNNIQTLKLHQKVEQSQAILTTALELGFSSVAMDLMYRYPGQTTADLEKELDTVLRLGVHGVSAYALDAGVRALDTVAALQAGVRMEEEMYFYIRDRLLDAGFVHVAQPDFARPGHENRQLYDLWGAPQAENLSFGAGAFSEWFNGCTWANVHNSERYIQMISAGELPVLIGQLHSWDDAAARYPALGVRCLRVPLQPFRDAFEVDFCDLFRLETASLIDRGFLEAAGDGLVVTRRGCFFIDNISKTFFNLRNRGKSQLWGVQLEHALPDRTYSTDEILRSADWEARGASRAAERLPRMTV